MKAILIDAVERTVRNVEFDGTLESAYSLLRCELIDVVHLPNIVTGVGDCRHDLFVDDEGLLTATSDDSPFFIFRCGHVYAGSGLIVGPCDDDGNTTGASLDARDFQPHVAFATREQLKREGIDPQPGIGFVIINNN